MRILAIDPGTEQSGWCEYDTDSHAVVSSGIELNSVLADHMDTAGLLIDRLAVEMVACYGMPVGRETFETCVWIGEFKRAWSVAIEKPVDLSDVAVYRREVKMYLCNSMRAKDKNVRQAILDRFEPTGGGKTPQIGTKTQPGPLYGVSGHVWSALGVALTFAARTAGQ